MTTQRTNRIQSIDILRGLIMVIMALDHTRDFFHAGGPTGDPLNLQTTTPLLFFTRWITHYCAPVFLFLSGLSAGLAAQKRSRAETAAFLIRRGFWLIVVEIAVITLGLTFNPLYHLIILQVIWAIGWSMVIMGLLLYLSERLIFIVGLMLVFGHNLFDMPFAKSVAEIPVIKVLFTSNGYFLQTGTNRFIGFLYAILPWTGIMMIGYSAARMYDEAYTAVKRKRVLIFSGLGLILLFIILRFVNYYGDPAHWSAQKTGLFTFLSFINVSKYPPSLLYTCITIGPALIVLAFTEQARNRLSAIFTVYGKVPFFYYVLHFYLLHTLLVICFFASGYGTKDIVPPNSPFLFQPPSFGYPIGIVYLIWLCVVAALYQPCKWYTGYKQRHKEKWWTHYV